MNPETKAELKIEEAAEKAVEVIEVARKQTYFKDNLKQVIISILIGAGVAFFSTLFEGIAQFLKTHSTEVVSGIATTMTYLAKSYKG